MPVRALADLFRPRGEAPAPDFRTAEEPEITIPPMPGTEPGEEGSLTRPSLDAARRRLAESFTPTRPLVGRRKRKDGDQSSSIGFIGREAERERIMRAVAEDRSHVVIFGERGRGKTSLANMVMAQALAMGFVVARHVCAANSDFDSIMRGLFRDIPRWLSTLGPAGPEDPPGALGLLPDRPVLPGDVMVASNALIELRLLLVVDEFDRVVDQETRTAFADTLKQLSDRGVPLSFVIIGVSESAEELLGRHPSIQRCVTRVPLPLLSHEEVEELVERGAERAGLDYSPTARACIAELARGVPYMGQLLALRAGQAALDHGRTAVQGSDLIAAMQAAVVEADPRIIAIYDSVTRMERDPAALGALRAAAAGRQDSLGRFQVWQDGPPDKPVLRVAGIAADPDAWRRVLQSGAIHPFRGDGPGLYVFGEAMLQQLVLLRAVLAQQAPRPGPGATPE
ncbi:ATP-binding protein [Roseicella sp. DB1501]|uniref:nSTAND1 domain-containing NTPase n=1 Tax=Roseicella sp. DB1501 TaxID=2730925 RepID=UPI00149283E5|nr:ATP-binding protein [Roseicella sp. DB1501]